MKMPVIALLCFFCGFTGFGQMKMADPGRQGMFQKLVGHWEVFGTGESGGGSLEIIDSSAIFVRFMGEEKKLLGYKIDFSKSPYWFDFSAKDSADSASLVNFKSLIEFVSEDILKWQVFTDEDRCEHFCSSKGELFYLRRTAPKSNASYYTDK